MNSSELQVYKTGSPEEISKALKGIGINIVVADCDRSRVFLEEVLRLEVVRFERGYIIARHQDMVIQLHEDHTFKEHPLYQMLPELPPRGIGVEIRLYGLNPNDCEARAIEKGYEILLTTAHHVHGLSECIIQDHDGYCWVPGVVAES